MSAPLRQIDISELEASIAKLDAFTAAYRAEVGEARWAELQAEWEEL